MFKLFFFIQNFFCFIFTTWKSIIYMVRNAKILLLCKKNVFKCITLKEYDHAFFVLEMILVVMIFLFISGVNGVKSENIETNANN